MTITADTDPATLMLEGRPEVKIVALGSINRRDVCYVYAERFNDADEWAGGTMHLVGKHPTSRLSQDTHQNVSVDPKTGRCAWGRIVPRRVLDPALPIVDGNGRLREVVGIYMPVNPDEAPIVHIAQRDPARNPLQVSCATGRTLNGLLNFRNQITTTHDHVLHGSTVRATVVDGKLTNVEIIA